MTKGERKELELMAATPQPAYVRHQNRSRSGVQYRLLYAGLARAIPRATAAETFEITDAGRAALEGPPELSSRQLAALWAIESGESGVLARYGRSMPALRRLGCLSQGCVVRVGPRGRAALEAAKMSVARVYFIRDTGSGSYYTGMTAIGPRFGGAREEAKPFDSEVAAVEETRQRGFGLVLWEVVNGGVK